MKMLQVVARLSFAYFVTASLAAQVPTNRSEAAISPDHGNQQFLARYGKLPLAFESNQGKGAAQFISHGSGYTLYLMPNQAVMALRTSADSPHTRTGALNFPSPTDGSVALRMKLIGSNPKAPVQGMDQMPGTTNYLIGNDTTKWRTNIPTFAKVEYQNLYPGINLIYRGDHRRLEYDFIVGPSAKPDKIGIQFDGADTMEVESGGDLVLHVLGKVIRQPRPVVYQEIDGARRMIEGSYVISNKNQVHFGLGPYDRKYSLTIDPELSYSTYLGGYGDDGASGIAVDSSGNAYVTGTTVSSNFPTTPDALQPDFVGGGFHAFVTKLNPEGSALIYSTYIAGHGYDNGAAIAVDDEGNAYVTGSTTSIDFPVTPDAFQTSFHGDSDVFVLKLNATGSALTYSTYLGGSSWDAAAGIALDKMGNAYVSGGTTSTNFPTTDDAFRNKRAKGSSNAFVSKLNPAGSALIYSTYLGPDSSGYGIALDVDGNAYVTGFAGSRSFPTTSGAFQTKFGGSSDAFVSKLNPMGSALVYSTFLGGSNYDYGNGIAVDANGNAYITGPTSSTNFPTTPDALQTTFGGGYSDAFVSKLNSTGTALVYSTYLGGNGTQFEGGLGIAVDALGNAYVTGATSSTNFPITEDAFQRSLAGYQNSFMTKLNLTGSMLTYSTYLGGNGELDAGVGMALDRWGNVFLSGITGSVNFPVTAGAFQTGFGGDFSDAFVSKFTIGIGPPTKISQCKDDRWKVFTVPRRFKSQGDCISYIKRGS
jgi:hypothetical protein